MRYDYWLMLGLTIGLFFGMLITYSFFKFKDKIVYIALFILVIFVPLDIIAIQQDLISKNIDKLKPICDVKCSEIGLNCWGVNERNYYCYCDKNNYNFTTIKLGQNKFYQELTK